MKKDNMEKSLKRFLKRKVSYSFSLLVAFMITGGVSLGSSTMEGIKVEKGKILLKIEAEEKRLEEEIAGNQEKLSE